jgi:hypothetical protein
MKCARFSSLFLLLVYLLFHPVLPPLLTQADAADEWWDDAWPYRIPVTVSGSGVAQVSIDFTTAFNTLGLNGALLDVRSLRVVPYNGVTPGAPLAHDETYSTMLEDADSPQIGESGSGVYWTVNNGSLQADGARFSQGSGSLKAIVENLPDGEEYPGVELHIADGNPLTDWRNYEVFVYDVWPEVNASALDQAPDLYSFKLYDTVNCPKEHTTQGGPPLALDQWNYASVSLKPLDVCTFPDLNNITRMEFHTRDNETADGNSGLWDDGDQLILWFDNVRLVDQDGGGVIKWTADGSTSKYYVYFDVLEHEGHPQPNLTSLGTATLTGSAGAPEAGGYFHQISGASTGGLGVWAAPPVEKILKTNAAPVASSPLRIYAAQDEFEPFQLVVRSASAQDLDVSISDFTKGSDTIAATNVTLHRVDYVNLTQLSDDFGRLGDWPDPLYPIAMGDDVAFRVGANQPLWFTIHVPRDAAAGVYDATVTIGSATIPVELQVWNFALPQEIHLAGEWGFGWSEVVEEYKGTIGGSVQSCYWNLVDALYEDFADHRLTPKGVGWPAGLNYPGGVAYDCDGNLDPDAWGDWDFHTLAPKYLSGDDLDNGVGFPSFLIKGPSSNWPPDSRPDSFCGEDRGGDPPGNSSYNDKWFQYWAAVSDYLGSTAGYAAKGYYHIVNEPQTFEDYDIVAYLAQQTKASAPNVRILVSEQVEPDIYNNPSYPGAKIDIWMPTVSNYQVERAHDRQLNHGEEVWWYFLYGDRPPLPNPTVIDRPGIEARITPWLAWLERVEGLLYYSTTAWDTNPWTQPWIYDANGDGFMFYLPKDETIAFNPCDGQSNRLVPSIRWELLREGMEDYEYLWLLNEGDPQIGVANEADTLAEQFIDSRTLFSRVPTDLYETRAAIAAQLAGPSAAKLTNRSAVAENETFHYLLIYHAGDTAHTVVISDTVPSATTVITATGSKSPDPSVLGQVVGWTVIVDSQEIVTLTIEAQGVIAGPVTNSATFSGTQFFNASAKVLVYTDRVYLPSVLRGN